MVSTSFDEHAKRISGILNNYQLFFVVGAPKSGTTWLQKALDAHSEIICAGEGHFADMFMEKLGAMLKKYYAHQQIVNNNVYEGKEYYIQKWEGHLNFLVTSFILSSFSQLEVPDGIRCIGDKTPANVHYMRLLHRLFPRAKFVNIVRDGRDTLVSTFKHTERVLRTDDKVPDVDRFLVEKTGLYVSRWVKSVERAESFHLNHPELIHTLRYEDLKQDFVGTFGKALQFLGVDDAEQEVSACEEKSSFRQLSGGRSPGEEDPDAFVRKGIVGDWKGNLTEEHLAIFYSRAAPLLTKLGYER